MAFGQDKPASSSSAAAAARRLQWTSLSRGPVVVAFVLVFVFVKSALTFNVDVNSKVIHEGPRGSCDGDCMFGFSVAQHREQGQPLLLVGAPTADAGQPDVIKGGAVYKCQPDNPGQCDLIPFDTKGNTLAPTGQQYDKKSGQWFGSLVKSSGDNGVVLACAPRYVWYSRNFKRREPIGTCYTARNNFAEFFEYSPCRTRKWGYHRQGSCQAGLGAAIAEDGNQVYVGAVGSWYWQGQMYSINVARTKPLLQRRRQRPQGQVFSQKLLSLRDQHKTAEGSPSDDDSYLGYSVATGEFNGDGDKADVVVGMPRGANLTGKVVLYNANLTNLNNMTGDQIGAYFGYSVATCDLNGDSLDDVIVGAPMYSNYEVMGKYETGRVYVVYQTQRHSFKQFDTLDGKNHKARFGLSVACAGNINLDGRTRENPTGIQDLVIGAPYDGPDHQGAIYIYLGTADGISKEYAQVIYGRDVDSRLRTFGWSVSAGMDLDNNEYPDILVGAYESNNAVFLKSAPVVHLDSEVAFKVASKQVDLNNKNCRLRDGTSVPCVDVEVTLEYDGVGVPDTIDLELQYILDAKKDKTKRLFFLKQEGDSERNQTITVRKGRKWRESFKVHLPASRIHDKLTSLDVQVKYSLAGEDRGGNFYGRQRRQLAPVLGHDDRLTTDTMSIQKNCGDDNLCVPNLSVQASHADAFAFGSEEAMEISVDIVNSGEDAFNAMLYLQLPREINYISANSSTSGVSILCSPPSAMNNRTLQCDVGNPLPAGTRAVVRIFLQPGKSTEADQEQYLSDYTFYLAANSSNPENVHDNEDNQMLIRIPLSVTADWRVTGTSKPPQIEYNITEELIPDKYLVEDQIGPEVIHIYDVKNKGPATIKEAEVFILWPSFTDDQEHLLYLLGVSHEPSDKVNCQSVPNINPLYIKTRESKGYAEALIRAQEMDAELGYRSRYSSSSQSSTTRGGSSWSSGSSSRGSGHSSQTTSSSSSSSSSWGSQGGRSGSSYGYETEDEDDMIPTRGGGVGGESATSSSDGNNRYGTVSQVADGAEETRLTDGTLVTGETTANQGSSSTTSTYHSSSSSSTSSSSGGPRLSSGWRLLENGTYIRIYDARSTGGGGAATGSRNTYPGGETTRLSSSGSSSGSGGSYAVDDNLNTIIGAARGPGDYHGTMSKSELEKEAGGSVFSSTNTETRHQVDNTRHNQGSRNRGSNAGSSYGSAGSSTSQGSSSSNSAGGSYGSNTRGTYGSHAGGSPEYGGGTRYEEGSYYDQDHRDNGRRQSGGGSQTGTRVEEGSYFDHDHASSGSLGSTSGSSGSSSSSSVSTTSGGSSGRWVWSETTNKWEWSEEGRAVSSSGVGSHSRAEDANTQDEGTTDSGWVMLPNGTQVRTYSSWSKSSKTTNNIGQGRRRQHNNGRKRQHQLEDGKPGTQSGSSDSGWIRLANGTMARRQKSWSRTTSYESSYGGVQLNPEDHDELASQLGHGEVHDNEVDTDSSWSPSGDLEEVRRKLEAKTKAHMEEKASMPSNIEPGFEDQYSPSRAKRQAAFGGAFKQELNCDPGTCTMMRCTVGPLSKDERVIFRVRSRLFTQTQIQSYARSVQISSKLVARITKLPYLADPMSISYQTQQVTTEVFPSEMGEGTISWWVWLLATLGGLLLLALICFCLYKCGFFKRKRHDGSPEREPLNSNGYH